MKIIYENGNTVIKNIKNFNLAQILDCGQAFRWKNLFCNTWEGIAFGKYLKVSQDGSTVVFYNTSLDEFYSIWYKYFDIERDYGKIVESLNSNEILNSAAEYGSGIRILRQDAWEALCSFIISQNNNIPRIKGIIERLCENFGEKIDGGYAFPTAEKIATLTLDDLAVLRSGFRAKYILDAAKKITDRVINLSEISKMPTDIARSELTKIYGVGEKVADCTLLYGMGHINAFPKDVWIKRAINLLFGGELKESQSENAGIIQQYIFFYARETKLEI